MIIPPPSEAFIEATKKMLDPVCPRFPEASRFLGRIASWARGAAEWFWLPLGPLAHVLRAIKNRGFMVDWARTPYMERLLCMSLPVGFAAFAISHVRGKRGKAPAA